MKINKKLIMLVMILLTTLLLVPNVVNASNITCERYVYSNDVSMKFLFKGLKLNKDHEYEFGLTKTEAEEVSAWHNLTEYTDTTATVDIHASTTDLRKTINSTDTGYITIRDKNDNSIVVKSYSVNLKMPFLQVTNYTVIKNGTQFNTDKTLNIALRNASNSKPYYQYEKITDEKLINKYKELKSKNGQYLELESYIKQTAPVSNWTGWKYWNVYDSFDSGVSGMGYPKGTISVPEQGLYYMWIYVAGNNLKPVYGCVLVDNLGADIALESISIPATQKVKIGTTYTFNPEFNPAKATNKILTWKSSDENVATIDNEGKLTALKKGSTIITATSKDGNKVATCTVTVVDDIEEKVDTKNSTPTSSKNESEASAEKQETNAKVEDNTVAKDILPKAGAGKISIFVLIIAISGIYGFKKYNNLKDVK